MKQHARTIALFLLLGALTTVALAWMFAAVGSVGMIQEAYQGSSQTTGQSGRPATIQWPAGTADGWPPPAWIATGRGRGTWSDSATGAQSNDENALVYQITVVRFGWPLPALQWQHGRAISRPEIQTIGGHWIMLPDWVESLPFMDHWSQSRQFPWRRRLPLEPVWPGFALDVLLYAVGLWLLLRARGAVRRALRSRRRQCLACGYPIGASALCTECGRPVVGAPV